MIVEAFSEELARATASANELTVEKVLAPNNERMLADLLAPLNGPREAREDEDAEWKKVEAKIDAMVEGEELDSVQWLILRAPREALLTFLDTVDSARAEDDDARTDVTAGLLANAEVTDAATQLVEASSSAPVLTPKEVGDYVRAAADIDTSEAFPEFHVVQDRDRWYHRISVFYGRTLGDVGGAFDDDADVVGLAYDVAPQFALMFGWALFDGDDDGRSAHYFGTSLNLHAFKSYFSGLFGG